MHRGSCLCGAITFTVDCELPAPDACHCSICRKISGHYGVSSDVPRESLKITGEDNITWFQSSEKIRRGFCAKCGSNLFFDPIVDTPWTAVSLGAFDTPTNTKIAEHIFVADIGDYYDIADDAPQYDTYPGHDPDA